MSFPLFLARHISLNPHSKGARSGLIIAITGISLSIIVMLVSIAVMMGFKQEVRQKIMGFEAQLIVAPKVTADSTSMIPLVDSAMVSLIATSLPPEANAALTIRQPAILKTPTSFAGTVIKAYDADYDWKFIRSNLIEGAIPDYAQDSTIYHVVISKTLAENLEVGTGDKLDAYFMGNGGAYRTRRLKIAGLFDSHFSDYDLHYIFASLPMLRRLGGLPEGSATLLEINGLGNDDEIDKTASEITGLAIESLYQGKTNQLHTVENIHDSAAIYFNWLALLDTNVVVILTLMALLAMLTLVSSLFILILRRVNMIGVLKALGASNRLIRRTFVILTMRLLFYGLVIGNLVGIGIILLQHYTHVIPLNPEAYYLDHVPVLLDIPSVIVLNIAVAAMSAIVLILPSAAITTIPPSRAINYE